MSKEGKIRRHIGLSQAATSSSSVATAWVNILFNSSRAIIIIYNSWRMIFATSSPII